MNSPLIFKWDVPNPFIERVVVAPADVDRYGHTNNVVYLRWLEQSAWAHSKFLGLDFEDYERIGAGCVAHRHEVDYLAPTFTAEELLVGTWIAENDGRVTMWRNYQIIRARDAKTVARGRTRWACIDMKNGRPRMQPPEFISAYAAVTLPK
jgi:acyl-CoA thioester hydrolase